MRPTWPILALLLHAALVAGCNQPTPEAAAFEALRRMDGHVHDRDLVRARQWAFRVLRLDPVCGVRAVERLAALEALEGSPRDRPPASRCTRRGCWLHAPRAWRPPAEGERSEWWPCRVTLNFPETPLGEALDFIRETTGLAIELDPRAPSDLLTVSLRLKDIPVDDALKLVAEQNHLDVVHVTDRVFLLLREKEAEGAEVSALLLPAGP